MDHRVLREKWDLPVPREPQALKARKVRLDLPDRWVPSALQALRDPKEPPDYKAFPAPQEPRVLKALRDCKVSPASWVPWARKVPKAYRDCRESMDNPVQWAHKAFKANLAPWVRKDLKVFPVLKVQPVSAL